MAIQKDTIILCVNIVVYYLGFSQTDRLEHQTDRAMVAPSAGAGQGVRDDALQRNQLEICRLFIFILLRPRRLMECKFLPYFMLLF